jgi:thiol-disulfide isomerase/thioredoxin
MPEHKHESHSEEKPKEHLHTSHKPKFLINQPKILWTMIAALVIILIISVATCGFRACQEKEQIQDIKQEAQQTAQQQTQQPTKEGTFTITGDQLCSENGKPIIMLVSTTWCPHCMWIKDTFDRTVKSYGGSIAAYHWELDTGDNILTDAAETKIPAELLAYYQKYNPQGSIPTFVFGCEYTRIGNGYERQNDLAAEENEFRDKIEKLIAG